MWIDNNDGNVTWLKLTSVTTLKLKLNWSYFYDWLFVEDLQTVVLFMIYVIQYLYCFMFCRFMEPAVIAMLGGVLPFGSIFIEMYVCVDIYISLVMCIDCLG